MKILATVIRKIRPQAALAQNSILGGDFWSVSFLYRKSMQPMAKIDATNVIKAHVYKEAPNTGSPKVGKPGQIWRVICRMDTDAPQRALKMEKAWWAGRIPKRRFSTWPKATPIMPTRWRRHRGHGISSLKNCIL